MPKFISKRAWTIECQPVPIPPPPPPLQPDPGLSRFAALSDLCLGYLDGLGYTCSRSGRMFALYPHSLLYRGPPDSRYLRDACRQHCSCLNIAPEIPAGLSPARAPSCNITEPVASSSISSDSEGSQAASDCTHTSWNTAAYKVTCSPELYGHPDDRSCQLASLNAVAKAGNLYENREFLGIGIPPYEEDDMPTEQTPQVFSSGTCVITVMMLEGIGNEGRDVEDWHFIVNRVDAIREKCVIPHGAGGWAKAGDNEDIGIFIHGPASKFKQLLDLKFACTADANGNAQCTPPEDQPPPAKKPKPDTSLTADGTTTPDPPEPGNQQCGNPCLTQDDCSPANNCLCASDKPIPLSSTWGTFRCTFVPHAAALLAAAMTLGNQCSGSLSSRCLLNSNGSLEIPAPAANPNTPMPTLATPELSCPCNCTYVSRACCLSSTKLVWEDAAEKIGTVVMAPNGTVCCDTTTGNWTRSPVMRDKAVSDPSCPGGGANLTAKIHI